MTARRSVRVADFIAETLAAHGISHVFLVTGGGAMHLNDALGRHPALRVVACHHEQACAMAAESYGRLSGRLAALNVTTGPGGINALNGVFGAWVDSIGMIVVSGQVRTETMMLGKGLPLRQLGDQEADIVRMVQGITKYAVVVEDARRVRYHLERALYLATHGRPGPTWLDVPMDVQGALVDPGALEGYDPAEDALPDHQDGDAMATLLTRLREARRPVLMAGAGVRISGALAEFRALITALGIPVVTGWNAHDAVPDTEDLYVGRPGTIGDRAGNFAVQNSDFLLVLGSRLNIRQVSYNWKSFARGAFKVVVDIDPAELAKPTVRPDLPICADLKTFIPRLRAAVAAEPAVDRSEWVQWCKARRERYPVVGPEHRQPGRPVNPYAFVEALFQRLPAGQKVVTGDGTACVVTFQAAALKEGQRLYTNSGSASMGYDLPAAIGAAFATGCTERIVCLAGDGSIMMNLQELQTIATHRLPIKVFVLNNRGYHSIRQTQQNYFPDNVVGCGEESGLGFPEWEKIAAAFGFAFSRATTFDELGDAIAATLADGPRMCEVVLDLDQQFAPKLSSRKLPDGRMTTSALEDLAPFLPREELRANMLIPLLDD